MVAKKQKTSKTVSKNKVVPYDKELVSKSSKIAIGVSSAFAAVAKSSIFSKCKKSNLQRVLREYV